MSIAQLCNRNVETANGGETALEVARRLTARRVGSVVVVDDQSRPMGILSDRDIATRLVAAGRDPARTLVTDIMTPMPTTVLESTSVEAALGHMRTGRLRRLPVVNGMDQLVGIVTLDDILRLLAQELSAIEGLIESETPPRAAGVGGST